MFMCLCFTGSVVRLQSLNLKPEALVGLDLPIEVKAGHIGESVCHRAFNYPLDVHDTLIVCRFTIVQSGHLNI